MNDIAKLHVTNLKRAASALDICDCSADADRVRAGAEFIKLHWDVSGDGDNTDRILDAAGIKGLPKSDFTTKLAVDKAIEGLSRLEKEAQFASWETDFSDLGMGLAVIKALRDKVKMLEQGRKGLDADFGGLEQEVKEGRKTITQLQVQGEVADKELMDLRLELRSTLDELTEARALLRQSREVVGTQLGIIENLAATLGRFKPA
jgi:hypothetical protein